ncbi:hypothetical protein CFB3_02640 [Clostridium folliculivorans]|uniref:Uncharacterized protein n=1 Tax=Clostridium folliculivorans TaxID=2886038 RepID=A0A9W6DBL9_9CLOT|nr:hypothetical protein CFOLD11_28990 [Clostridium folliculivorans]GKU28158.1 hypothetical protein CFB3_02640 [Clostridium folliculivorans]
MEVLSMWFKLLITIIISTVIFSIIFFALNKSMLKLFVPIQNFTSKLKRNRIYSGIIFIGTFIILSTTYDNYNLGYISYGVLFGLVNVLIGICFF